MKQDPAQAKRYFETVSAALRRLPSALRSTCWNSCSLYSLCSPPGSRGPSRPRHSGRRTLDVAPLSLVLRKPEPTTLAPWTPGLLPAPEHRGLTRRATLTTLRLTRAAPRAPEPPAAAHAAGTRGANCASSATWSSAAPMHAVATTPTPFGRATRSRSSPPSPRPPALHPPAAQISPSHRRPHHPHAATSRPSAARTRRHAPPPSPWRSSLPCRGPLRRRPHFPTPPLSSPPPPLSPPRSHTALRPAPSAGTSPRVQYLFRLP